MSTTDAPTSRSPLYLNKTRTIAERPYERCLKLMLRARSQQHQDKNWIEVLPDIWAAMEQLDSKQRWDSLHRMVQDLVANAKPPKHLQRDTPTLLSPEKKIGNLLGEMEAAGRKDDWSRAGMLGRRLNDLQPKVPPEFWASLVAPRLARLYEY